MQPLPDDAVVVRGGQNLPQNFAQASGVKIGSDGKVYGVSVNAALVSLLKISLHQ
jgi:hypothetical protein